MIPGLLLLAQLLVPAVGADAATGGVASAPADSRWVEVTPLLGDAPVRLLRYTLEDPSEEVTLRGGGRQLVCQGGQSSEDPWALRCTEHLVDDGTTVPLVWEEGVEVAGRVQVDGEPAAGTRVTVLPAGLRTVRFRSMPLGWDDATRKLVRSLESDAEGRFELPPFAPGDYILALRLPGGRLVHTDQIHVPAPAELRRGRGRGASPDDAAPLRLDLGELSFDGGATLRVIVVDGDGRPVEGAGVGAMQGAREDTAFFETDSDPEGIARLSGLDPLLATELSCGGDGFRRQVHRFPSPPPQHVCELERLASLDGRVIDPEGEPVRATVRLEGLPVAGEGSVANEPVRREPVTADVEGRFRFWNLPAGQYDLTITAPGHSRADLSVSLETGDERSLEPVVLEVGRRWEGRVVDRSTGEPVPGALLSAFEPPGAFETVTDEDGGFEAVTGVEHPVGVAVEARGYPRTRLEVTAEARRADGPVVLEIAPGGFIEVQYWNADGEPCGGCPVGINGPTETRGLATDASGLLRTAALAPGTYQVTPVDLRSYGGVVTRSGGSRNRLVEVRPGAVRRVVLGEPRVEVEVETRPPPPAGWKLGISGGAETEILMLGTDGRGLVRWPSGPVELRLLDGAGGHVELARIAEPPRDRRLRLELPEGSVSGGMTADSPEAIAGTLVELVEVATGRVRARAVAAADGSFELRFIPPGTYAVAMGSQIVRTVAVGNRPEPLGELAAPKP